MTDAALQPKIPLGVGSIIGNSFSILFQNIVPILLVLLIPIAVQLAASSFLIGLGATIGTAIGDPQPQPFANTSPIYSVLVIVIQVVISSIATALLVQLAYDTKLGRPVQLSRYFGPAISSAIPIAILSIVAGLLAGLAAIALIIPGLWVYAVFSVIVPAVVIEKAGFGALKRSAILTKEYRWPILGTILIIGLCALVPILLSMFLAGMLVSALDSTGLIIAIVIYVLLNIIAAGLGGIAIALIYARLREIKEGMSVDQIAAVFD